MDDNIDNNPCITLEAAQRPQYEVRQYIDGIRNVDEMG
jgi:hypothetical protein